MNTSNKRAKIAEFKGYKNINKRNWHGQLHGRIARIPDYFSDLNDMHQAEASIPDYAWPRYREKIRIVVLGGPGVFTHHLSKVDIHAKASQKAEAFGRTFGLW